MHKKRKKRKSVRAQIGEKLIDIILIIFSIYVALSVESWAEKKHDHKRLVQYYKSFINEAKQDIDVLKKEQTDAEKQLKNSAYQLKLIAGNGPADSILYYSGKMLVSGLFGSSSMVSYQSMLASGDMKLVESMEIRKNLVELDGTYKSMKFQEDMYSSFLTNDLKNYLYYRFDLVKFKPLNPKFYKQTRYKNILIMHQSQNAIRLQQYKDAIKVASELIKTLEANLKKES